MEIASNFYAVYFIMFGPAGRRGIPRQHPPTGFSSQPFQSRPRMKSYDTKRISVRKYARFQLKHTEQTRWANTPARTEFDLEPINRTMEMAERQMGYPGNGAFRLKCVLPGESQWTCGVRCVSIFFLLFSLHNHQNLDQDR